MSASPLPLTRFNRLRIARAFNRVKRVDLSIDCVIEDQMGHVLVDDPQSPSVYRLTIGPFNYFAGDPSSAAGQALLATLPPYSLLMPSAPGWAAAAKARFQTRLTPFSRYSFASDTLSADRLQSLINQTPPDLQIKKIDVPLAQQVRDQDHFVDLSDYESAEDFVDRGIGYMAEVKGQMIGGAYASLVCSRGIEVSIFVSEGFRRRGVATGLASHLLLWCVERGVHPNWDAANPMSCALAEKLGYRPLGEYTAYVLRGKPPQTTG